MLAAGHLGWRYVSGFFAALMIICLVGIFFIHETPEWLLETRQFEKATKALEFYKTDKKLLVSDENKRNSKKSGFGEEKSYEELVKLYRIESKKHSKAAKMDEEDEKKPLLKWVNYNQIYTFLYD